MKKAVLKHKGLFAAVCLVLAAAVALCVLWTGLGSGGFPEATGTLSMVSLSNPKLLKGADRYIDLDKMDEKTWRANAAGEEVFMPYGLLCDGQGKNVQAVKGSGVISDSGLAYSGELQAYYGVSESNAICTFALEEGNNEFPREFKQEKILYPGEGGNVYEPLYLDDVLYFAEGQSDGRNALCRYDENGQKEELVDNAFIIYGIGGSKICYEAVAENGAGAGVYVKTSSGESELLAENAGICGRSSDGGRVLLRYYGEDGQTTSAAVYDCEKGSFLSEVPLQESWGWLTGGAVSPDSRFIAACFRTEPEQYQVRMIDMETGRQTQLFKDLSPDLFVCSMNWA